MANLKVIQKYRIPQILGETTSCFPDIHESSQRTSRLNLPLIICSNCIYCQQPLEENRVLCCEMCRYLEHSSLPDHVFIIHTDEVDMTSLAPVKNP